jgi:Protein of unknown function (DUF1553)/Protein of unknown function (DUF1549)
MCRIVAFALSLVLLFGGWARPADPPADWAFRPIGRPLVPRVSAATTRPIDAFLLQRLEEKGLSFSPPEGRARLLRRVSYDLTGLPPSVAELDAFLADQSPQAFAKQVDRLLNSPAYGERQALPWLDVVRFAESDGFKADDFRPTAWRYRDYVIRSFNADKPFDRFIKEQLAGDELYPDEFDALIATGFLRHYPVEYNAVNLEQRRQETLNDITDTAGQAFLGITFGCAKCHDHKFDPISQEDYYRVQAFFVGWKEVDAVLAPPAERADFENRLRDWDEKTAETRRQLEELERPYREKFSQQRRGRFQEEYAKLLDTPEDQRTPLERQIAAMVAKQVYADDKGMFNGMKPPEKERRTALLKTLAEAGPKPQAPATAIAFNDIGRDVPPTHLLKRGNWSKKGAEIRPGFLSAFDNRLAEIVSNENAKSTGRRTVLANWIADPKNPLTARVIVNRVWQQHFGRGIVASAGDFGAQGDRPTHPELLDWLANEFVSHGWSLKHLHRIMVLSDAYQQGSAFNSAAAKLDPANNLFWRMNRRRLDGETLRDAILSAAGTLNLKAGGPSVYPELPAEIKASSGAWPVSSDSAERNRRSVYVCVKRNLRYPFFAEFDSPERSEACSRRFETTTAPQALMLLNEKLYVEKARQFAERVTREAGSDADAAIDRAYRIALSRLPTPPERTAARQFVEAQSAKAGGAAEALADFCHALFNLNEFVYVD